MACTPFVVAAGPFTNLGTNSWSSAPTTTLGGKKVTRTLTGGSPGITVEMAGKTPVFHALLANRNLRYLFFGTNNNLLILDSETGPGSVTHRITVVDFTGPAITENNILTGLASSTAVPSPAVLHSAGLGSAVLVFSSSGTDVQGLNFFRSETGVSLCPSGVPPFVPSGFITAEATATQLIAKDAGLPIHTCNLPLGNCKVDPPSQDF